MTERYAPQETTALTCWLRAATSGGTPRRALITALIVGPILILINQWDALFAESAFDYITAALTIAVPYCVATIGACGARCGRRKSL